MDNYETIAITRCNYADVWDVYASNPDYFLAHKGRVAKFADITNTFDRLIDGYDPAKQYFVGLRATGDCPPHLGTVPGKFVATLELLPDFPKKGELWLSEIIIHGKHQRIGLGAAIVKAVIAASSGFERIALGTDEHLLTFWERLGFNENGRSGGFVYFEHKTGNKK